MKNIAKPLISLSVCSFIAFSFFSCINNSNNDSGTSELQQTKNPSFTVQDKNIFCLISPISFSCGNLVPSVLKASNRATILGVTSGGGAAVVHKTSTADSTIFQISSKYVLSVSKNGSNYDIDQGVEPHYHINRPENFYNTEKIADLVRSINEAKFDIENS